MPEDGESTRWERFYPKLFWTIIALAAILALTLMISSSLQQHTLRSDLRFLITAILQIVGMIYIGKLIGRRVAGWAAAALGLLCS